MLIILIFALGTQKNRLTEYNLPMLWLGPHLYEKGSFYARTLPAIEGEGGIQWCGGGGCIIFSTDPVGVGHGGIGHE